MSTTTLRLPEPLRKTIRKAAAHAGVTPHNFMLAAIAEKTERAALRRDFDEQADRRYERFVTNGKAISWADMRRHLEARAQGKATKGPVARKLI